MSIFVFQSLPNFGPYKEEREKRIASLKASHGLSQRDIEPRFIDQPEDKIPSLRDVVGRALPMVGAYGDLDNRQQKVALIDEVRIKTGHGMQN